jgi:hypothetical protein
MKPASFQHLSQSGSRGRRAAHRSNPDVRQSSDEADRNPNLICQPSDGLREWTGGDVD